MILDAHQHFWKYIPERDTWITEDMKRIQRDFLPEDLQNILKANRIEGCVAVQADQSEKETEFLLQCARNYPFVKGVVGWTDLQSPGVQARLEYYFQFDELKGFRHVVQGEPAGFLERKEFLAGIALLEQYHFTYDILIYHHQLNEALAFIKKFPNQRFVIDHIAKPDIRNRQFKPWKELITRIAMHENVYCKLSGMVTEGDRKNWKPTDFTPYLDTVWEAFGSRRIMYGSDWPVCLVAAEYEQQFNIVNHFLTPCSPSERKAVLGTNAQAFYHI